MTDRFLTPEEVRLTGACAPERVMLINGEEVWRAMQWHRLASDKPGKVYVLFDCASRAYKIGFTSKSARSRLRDIRTGNCAEINIVWQGTGTPGDESAIHRLLAPSRISGEWFAQTDVVRIAVSLVRVYGARWVGEMEINQLETFVPHGRKALAGLPKWQHMRPLSEWGSGGYWPKWSIRL